MADPYIKEGGRSSRPWDKGEARSQNKFFSAPPASVWRGGPGPLPWIRHCMWLSALEIDAAQLRPVKEIAQKSPFLFENRTLSIRYGFHAGAKAIRYGVRYSRDEYCANAYKSDITKNQRLLNYYQSTLPCCCSVYVSRNPVAKKTLNQSSSAILLANLVTIACSRVSQ